MCMHMMQLRIHVTLHIHKQAAYRPLLSLEQY
jgi:hypothetical protein